MEIIKKINEKNNDIYGKKPVTIAFLGDSVTHGCFDCFYKLNGDLDTVFDRKSSYALKVEKFLNYLYPAAQINIINSGISGDSTKGGLERFDRDISPFSPDLVVVAYALNDCGWGIEKIDEYANYLKQIFDKVKALGSECIFLTPNLMNDKVSPHLEKGEMRNLAERFTQNCLDEYVEKAKEVSLENNVPVCDVHAKWKLMQENGVDITELLANKLNHPAREMTYLTAYSLVETMFKE